MIEMCDTLKLEMHLALLCSFFDQTQTDRSFLRSRKDRSIRMRCPYIDARLADHGFTAIASAAEQSAPAV